MRDGHDIYMRLNTSQSLSRPYRISPVEAATMLFERTARGQFQISRGRIASRFSAHEMRWPDDDSDDAGYGQSHNGFYQRDISKLLPFDDIVEEA